MSDSDAMQARKDTTMGYAQPDIAVYFWRGQEWWIPLNGVKGIAK